MNNLINSIKNEISQYEGKINDLKVALASLEKYGNAPQVVGPKVEESSKVTLNKMWVEEILETDASRNSTGAIVNVLSKKKDFMSPEDIWAALKVNNYEISLSTIKTVLSKKGNKKYFKRFGPGKFGLTSWAIKSETPITNA